MPILSASQMNVIECLAAGRSQVQAAKVTGVTRQSIGRWVKQSAFLEELDRRKALKAADDRLTEAVEKSRLRDPAELQTELERMQEESRRDREVLSQAAYNLLMKASRRLEDLPDEAITPQLVPQYLKTAMDIMETVEAKRAEELALQETIEQLLSADAQSQD